MAFLPAAVRWQDGCLGNLRNTRRQLGKADLSGNPQFGGTRARIVRFPGKTKDGTCGKLEQVPCGEMNVEKVVALGKLKGPKFIDRPPCRDIANCTYSRRARYDHYTVTKMIYTRYLYISSLLACALAAISQPPHLTRNSPYNNPHTPKTLHPRAPPKIITTQSTGAHVTWGNYAITFWKTAAFLPIASTAHPMAEFYQKAALEAVKAITCQLVTNTFTFGLGALNLYVDTLDGSPIDWQMLLSFASNMVGGANRGWTGHYGALVKDRVTGVLTVVSLEAAGGVARSWLSGGSSVEQSRNDPFGG